MSDPGAFPYSTYPVAVTLPFRDWGRISGILRTVVEERDPPPELAVEMARWLEVITRDVWKATDLYLGEDI